MAILESEQSVPPESLQAQPLASPEIQAETELATWSLQDQDFIPVYEWQEHPDSGESRISAAYNGEAILELDVANWPKGSGQIDIIGSGRPANWQRDDYSEQDKQVQYQASIKSTIKHLAETRPELETLTIEGSDRSLNEAVVRSGRPQGWQRTFVTWGTNAGQESRDFQESTDPEDTLRWLSQGGSMLTVYDRPLRQIGDQALSLAA